MARKQWETNQLPSGIKETTRITTARLCGFPQPSTGLIILSHSHMTCMENETITVLNLGIPQSPFWSSGHANGANITSCEIQDTHVYINIDLYYVYICIYVISVHIMYCISSQLSTLPWTFHLSSWAIPDSTPVSSPQALFRRTPSGPRSDFLSAVWLWVNIDQ